MTPSARRRLALAFTLSAAALGAAAARAGPAHVLAARAFAPFEGGTIALDPAASRSPAAARALGEALTGAGYTVVPLDARPALVATVEAQSRPLCGEACSSLTHHDDAALSDHYTRRVLVVARRNVPEDGRGESRPVVWYAALRSDGLSDRLSDSLPSLLRAGAKVYGRDVQPVNR